MRASIISTSATSDQSLAGSVQRDWPSCARVKVCSHDEIQPKLELVLKGYLESDARN
jgi:hypothetical protein